MSDEKKGNKLEDTISETKGVAEKFVSILGLTDLIIGGLILYWVRLEYGSYATTLFISTGHEWVDIAILACGAAFVGKIISLYVPHISARARLPVRLAPRQLPRSALPALPDFLPPALHWRESLHRYMLPAPASSRPDC